MKMQDRGKLINRLALVLLSIVVLELILIGDQVQPVKAIKKKIFLKKLKKVLPLLALVKPKKKIILVPIPIPMFNKNNPHQRYPFEQTTNMRPMTMITDGLNPPNSFTMISGEPGLVGVGGPSPMHMQQMPMTMTSSNLPEPTVLATGDSPTPVMMPSMTMTIQSDASGGSAIELSMQNASSANLMQQRPAAKWNSNHHHQQQQQQQQQHFDYFDEPNVSFNGGEPAGGEHYYSSPWLSSRPLASPAKLLRNERLRKQQRQLARPHQQTIPLVSAPIQRPTPAPLQPQTSGRLQQQQQQQRPPLMPVLVIKNQWHPTESKSQPTGGRQSAPGPGQHQARPFNNLDPFQRQIQQQIHQALEVEELVPVGPPQLMPIYQTPNGQLHVSPPGQQSTRPAQQAPKGHLQQQQQQVVAQAQVDPSSFEHEQEPNEPRPAANQSANNNSNSNDAAEVQTVANSSSGNLSEGVTSPPAAGHNLTPVEPANPDNQQQQTFRPPAAGGTQRPASPAVKGKQQQQQQQQPATKRKPQVAAGGY